MKKLARKWRKSHDDKSSLPIWDDEDSLPLDTEEQEELVRSLEKTQALQSLLWRSVFAGFLVGYVAFQLFSIYQQATSPWELRFHAYFMEDLDSWIVISAGWLAVLACSMAVMGLIHNSKHHREWIWYSCYTGFILDVKISMGCPLASIWASLVVVLAFVFMLTNCFRNRLKN